MMIFLECKGNFYIIVLLFMRKNTNEYNIITKYI